MGISGFLADNAEYISYSIGMLIPVSVMLAVELAALYLLLPKSIRKELYFEILGVSAICGIMFLYGFETGLHGYFGSRQPCSIYIILAGAFIFLGIELTVNAVQVLITVLMKMIGGLKRRKG